MRNRSILLVAVVLVATPGHAAGDASPTAGIHRSPPPPVGGGASPPTRGIGALLQGLFPPKRALAQPRSQPSSPAETGAEVAAVEADAHQSSALASKAAQPAPCRGGGSVEVPLEGIAVPPTVLPEEPGERRVSCARAN